MAIKLIDKPNTEAATVAYPYGAIKDNIPSVQAGTPVNKLVMEDYIQFFHRLMAFANKTYNELPENSTNGFQFIEALNDVIANNDMTLISGGAGQWESSPLAVVPTSGTITNIATSYNRYKIIGKTLFWQFAFTADFASNVQSFDVRYPSALADIGVAPKTPLAAQPQVWESGGVITGGISFNEIVSEFLRYGSFGAAANFPNDPVTIYGNITTEVGI
jgi:hypothetical protein